MDRFASLHLASVHDQPVPTPSPAEQARTLASQVTNGTLCTICQDPPGYPHGTLVAVAFEGGYPVLRLGDVAEHTRHLHADARASLLVSGRCVGEPLANARMTLLGECRPAADRRAAARVFLEQHPDAARYAGFDDFAYWRLEVSVIHYVGGHGRMSWVRASEYLAAQPDPLGSHAAGIIERMNDGNRDALLLYCRALARSAEVSEATMTAIDRLGFEMTAKTPDGPRSIRLAFAEPIKTPTQARRVLATMLHEARTKLGTYAGA